MDKRKNSVVAIIVNENGNVLLLRRHDHDRTYKGWCLPGGKVDDNESLHEALVREVYEEVGMEVTNAHWYCSKSNDKFNIHFFITEVKSTEVILNTDELHSCGWWGVLNLPHNTLPITHSVLSRFPAMEFALISQYYGDKKAKRSGVRYINHITEGLCILENINAPLLSKKIFAVHPLVQSDNDLLFNLSNYHLGALDYRVLLLAMEYRNTANNHLSDSEGLLQLSCVEDVNYALLADKVQNQKDFRQYHQDHERYEDLRVYFKRWIGRLLSRLDLRDNEDWIHLTFKPLSAQYD